MIFYFYILFFLIFFSCSEFQKALKSDDFDYKLKLAFDYYEKKDYFKAKSLLESLEATYKMTPFADKVLLYLGYCYLYEKDYYTASYYFKSVSSRYPLSQYREEADFMYAYTLYLDSPNYQLDQSNTYKALDALQEFINNYPNSDRINECNKMIDKLREKLETKLFEAAKLYFDIEEFKAAKVSFKHLLNEYPDTKYREIALYYIAKSSFLHAFNSIESKKNERLEEAINEYYKFKLEYPESKFKNEIERYYNVAINYLKK